jgi:membrane protein required for colicin V production
VDVLTAFDALILALVAFAGVVGLARGFVGEVVSLGAWVAGVLAVRFFHMQAKLIALRFIEDEALAAVVALLVLFIGAFALVRILGGMVSQTTRTSVIGPIDRLLGLGFGVAKGIVAAVLLFLLVTMGLEVTSPGVAAPSWLRDARTAPALAILSRALVDFVDEQTRISDDVATSEDPHAGLPGFPRPAERKGGGYDRDSRSALDKLLDEQEKQTPSTPI